MPKVINLRDTGGKVPEGAKRVDRRTKWGNPFRITEARPREEVIEQYREYLNNSLLWTEAEIDLRGYDLACWCAPLPCHADILLEISNE